MRKILFLFYLFISSIGLAKPPDSPDDKDAPDGFTSETPVKLKEAWLRFHELDLCQGLDAKFIFNKEEMMVNVLIEDAKLYQKFMGIIEPLKSSYKIVVDASKPEKKEAKEEKDNDHAPPASLCENYELRSYLHDPFARRLEHLDSEQQKGEADPGLDDMLKQQLLVFAEKVLSLNKRLKRYSDDLPDLMRAITDSDPDIRAHALSAAKSHAQSIEKSLKKLSSLLSHAFPPPNKKEKNAGVEYESQLAGKASLDRALCFSKSGNALSVRIEHFIHPKDFTVNLKELRRPALLEELALMQKMNSEFIKELGKP